MNDNLTAALAKEGVFKGFEGLRGLAGASEFWERQPYGTRFYYGPGGLSYLHRSVLEAAIRSLERSADLEREVAELREAAQDYMCAFGQALEACGIPFGEQQRKADERIRAALKPHAQGGSE